MAGIGTFGVLWLQSTVARVETRADRYYLIALLHVAGIEENLFALHTTAGQRDTPERNARARRARFELIDDELEALSRLGVRYNDVDSMRVVTYARQRYERLLSAGADDFEARVDDLELGASQLRMLHVIARAETMAIARDELRWTRWTLWSVLVASLAIGGFFFRLIWRHIRALLDDRDRHHRELERLVDERTAALERAQARLLRQQRLATLGQVTGTIAHELRHPLGTLRLTFFSLRRRAAAAGLVDGTTFDKIDRNIDRCDRVIEDLLDFTRTKSLEPLPTVIDEWVEACLDERPLPRDVRLECALHGSTSLRVDREGLRRALLNVIDNACQAMAETDDRDCVLTIDSHVDEHAWTLRISDTGPGVDPAHQAEVFEPLFSTKPFGVGLGLPVVAQIMAQHGGGVGLDSELGRGTTVSLWIPVESPEV